MWNGKKKAITFSFDDGTIQDVRLIEILNKYGLKGTFNLNSSLLGLKRVIEINGKEFRIPCSNRLILFYDPIHRLLPIAQDYCSYYENNPHHLTSYLLSGFDAVVDVAVIEERLDDSACTKESVLQDNRVTLELCKQYGCNYILIEDKYEQHKVAGMMRELYLWMGGKVPCPEFVYHK